MKKKAGWQQPPQPVKIQCQHLGRFFASFALHHHKEGDEWICPCGKVFTVVSNAGKEKRLVEKTW